VLITFYNGSNHAPEGSFFNGGRQQGCQMVYFKPKIPIWVNFGGSYIENVYIPILWPFGIFYVHLEYFMSIWNILCPFGRFYVHLEYFMDIWEIL
jgi:hypothetical protein